MPLENGALDTSQRGLRAKIVHLLSAHHWPPSIIESYRRGYCNGLATLLVYHEYLKTIQPIDPEVRAALPNYFELQLKKLAAWNGDLAHLTLADQLDLVRLFTLCNYIQHIATYQPCGQGDLHAFLTGENNQKPLLEFTIAGLFKRHDFFTRHTLWQQDKWIETSLFEQLLQYQHRLILVSSGGHTVSLFRDGDTIAYFSGNHKSGKRIYSLQESSKLMRAIFKSYHYDKKGTLPLGFRIFTYGSPGAYVKPTDILTALNAPLTVPNPKSKYPYSALYLAARVGSHECAKYYLEQGAKMSEKIRKTSALTIAANRGHVDIVKDMLLFTSYKQYQLIKVLRHFKHDEHRIRLLDALALETSPALTPKQTQLFKHRSYPPQHSRFFVTPKKEEQPDPLLTWEKSYTRQG